MVSSNIRDLLTAFSPSLDYLAISSGDGRIKIWDTVKGQVQTEFADITSNDADLYTKAERGHLSVDYTCMKWLSLDRKKKRKLASSLLILGTGSGDVLALDVSAGQLKWRVNDCHPGGVSAISFSTRDSCIYTAGADGMFCKIDPQTGNMVGKFRASSKAISSLSVSPDGKILATAAAQLTIFNCSDHKKIQKFSGHPGSVSAMIFTEDGKYVLSSAIGERYIALWRTDGGKKQSASCVLAMEHPAVFLDSRCLENEGVDDPGLCVLAISETGVCYTWYGKSIEELRNAKPTKVALSNQEYFSKNHKGALPTIFAAKLQGIAEPMAAHVFIAYGLLVKPLFQKIIVHSGTDVKLNASQDGVLLPMSQSLIKPKRGKDLQNSVTALDRANVEDALLPIPKVSNFHEKRMRDKALSINSEEVMADLIDGRCQPEALEKKEVDTVTTCIEKQLRLLEILGSKDDGTFSSTLASATFDGIDLEANTPQKKMRAAVLSLEPSYAYKLLEILLAKWQSRSCSGQYVLPWIYCILVNHGHSIVAQEKPESHMLNSLLKVTKSRGVAIQPLLQLSGRLQLVTAQINQAAANKTHLTLHNVQMNYDEDEDDDDDIDERLYGEDDDESQLSSDDNN
ncbi:WD repeat-containing protein 43 isoform X2 [Jatropha curcas]|uniref:WD repeat-containing protein 43 isoform X2 n=1 Tax=Jatropha curcas TaxID=180498 RepID=UPI0018937257|nr:WD repeat-containing protein 43 isoform X2 [Jatropha curcas]